MENDQAGLARFKGANSVIGAMEAEAIDAIRGKKMKLCPAQAQTILLRPCGPNCRIRGIAAEEIAVNSGSKMPSCSAEHAHAEFARSYSAKADSVRRAEEEIECRRGTFANSSAAYAHAVVDRFCG